MPWIAIRFVVILIFLVATTVSYLIFRTAHLKNGVKVVCRRSVRALLPFPRGLAEFVTGARSIAFRRAT